jgi:hypothetical protein
MEMGRLKCIQIATLVGNSDEIRGFVEHTLMNPPSRPTRWLSYPTLRTLVCLGICMAVGCEEERNVGGKPKPKAVGGTPISKAKAAPQREFIVGKRTQDISNAAPALREKGTKVATTKITAKDYISLQGNAYVSIIGRTSVLNIEHAIDLYKATNDRYPKDHDEFMNEIIKANNISLPQLPYYQKYGYDEKEHKLVILESEELKNQPLGQ